MDSVFEGKEMIILERFKDQIIVRGLAERYFFNGAKLVEN